MDQVPQQPIYQPEQQMPPTSSMPMTPAPAPHSRWGMVALAVLVAIATYGISSYFLDLWPFMPSAEVAVSPTPTFMPDASPNIFDKTQVSVGEKYGTMTVAKTGRTIEFMGTATLRGTLSAPTGNPADIGIGPDYAVHDLTPDSLRQLPYEKSDTKVVWFGINNPEVMSGLGLVNGDTVELTISYYYYPLIESAAWNNAEVISITKVAASGATANWPAYANTQYGFEIKYPTNFHYTERDPNDPRWVVGFDDREPSSADVTTHRISVIIESNPVQLSPNLWINDRFDGFIPDDLRQTSVSGDLALQTARAPGIGLPSFDTYIFNGTTVYNVRLWNSDSYRQVYDQMLDTFRSLPSNLP